MSQMSVAECISEFVRSMRENGHDVPVSIYLHPRAYERFLADMSRPVASNDAEYGTPYTRSATVNVDGDRIGVASVKTRR